MSTDPKSSQPLLVQHQSPSLEQSTVYGYPVEWYSEGQRTPTTHQTPSNGTSTATTTTTNNDDNENRSRELLRALVGMVAFAMIFCFIIIIAGVYALLKTPPSPAQFEVDSLTVSSMTISSNNNTGRYGNDTYFYITANFNTTLLLVTTGRTGLLYESIVVSIRHDGTLLSSMALAPFYQENGDRETMQVWMASRLVEVSDVGIARDLATEGSLEFEVDVHGHYRHFEHGSGSKCFLEATCKGIKVEFLSPHNLTTPMTGNMVGRAAPCKSSPEDCP